MKSLIGYFVKLMAPFAYRNTFSYEILEQKERALHDVFELRLYWEPNNFGEWLGYKTVIEDYRGSASTWYKMPGWKPVIDSELQHRLTILAFRIQTGQWMAGLTTESDSV